MLFKSLRSLLRKIGKSVLLVRRSLYRNALQYGVAAAIEHEQLLASLDCTTVIDIGANRGQFALVGRHCFPHARIFSFEPLPEPAAVYRQVFSHDSEAVLYDSAIGPKPEQRTMQVSARDDSSSLLPISSLQREIFPGTNEVGTVDVRVAPLNAFVREDDFVGPAMLKLDVQGFELEALRGCESLLSRFDWVYCECSFVELYSGQKLAAEVIDWLSGKGFQIKGIYNPVYDREGRAVQADFLFRRNDVDGVSCGL